MSDEPRKYKKVDFKDRHGRDGEIIFCQDELGSGKYGSVHVSAVKVKEVKTAVHYVVKQVLDTGEFRATSIKASAVTEPKFEFSIPGDDDSPPAVSIDESDNTNTISARKSLQKECRVLGRLNFLHIVEYIGSYDDDTVTYLVLGVASLGSIKALLRKKKYRRTAASTRVFARDVLLALEYIHNFETGLAHLDVKGDNILLADINGKVFAQLSDFGLCKPFGEKVEGGTKPFMPCELFLEKDVKADYNQDMYSYGCLLYELIFPTGPFELDNGYDVGNLKAQKFGIFEQYKGDNAKIRVPKPLMQFVETLTHDTPEERPNASTALKSLELINPEVISEFLHVLHISEYVPNAESDFSKNSTTVSVRKLEDISEFELQLETERWQITERERPQTADIEQIQPKVDMNEWFPSLIDIDDFHYAEHDFTGAILVGETFFIDLDGESANRNRDGSKDQVTLMLCLLRCGISGRHSFEEIVSSKMTLLMFLVTRRRNTRETREKERVLQLLNRGANPYLRSTAAPGSDCAYDISSIIDNHRDSFSSILKTWTDAHPQSEYDNKPRHWLDQTFESHENISAQKTWAEKKQRILNELDQIV